mmetsp:Transcript_23394/g.46521  ORF Transcript_23394/g.46521 Transcript_23394/m.46521 type:complete len:222 (-) Transcript_23394:56-721(-)
MHFKALEARPRTDFAQHTERNHINWPHCLCLVEVGVRSNGLEGGTQGLRWRALDSVRQRELHVARVLLAVQFDVLEKVLTLHISRRQNASFDDLDTARACSVATGHLTVHGVDRVIQGEGAVLAVHIVCARARVVAQPDTIVLHCERVRFANLVDVEDFTVGLLHVTVLVKEVPKSRLRDDLIGCEKLHAESRRLWDIFSRSFSPYHLVELAATSSHVRHI